MIWKFLSDKSGATLQTVATTAGALAICCVLAAAFLDRTIQSPHQQSAQSDKSGLRDRLASLPKALGGGTYTARGGIDYGTTATVVPGIRNVILDPCNGMPK